MKYLLEKVCKCTAWSTLKFIEKYVLVVLGDGHRETLVPGLSRSISAEGQTVRKGKFLWRSVNTLLHRFRNMLILFSGLRQKDTTSKMWVKRNVFRTLWHLQWQWFAELQPNKCKCPAAATMFYVHYLSPRAETHAGADVSYRGVNDSYTANTALTQSSLTIGRRQTLICRLPNDEQ